MRKKNICILLTGTIAPNSVPNLERADPTIRETDYINSLTKWIDLGYPAVFIENSNYNSRIINELTKNKNFEYIKFKSEVSHLGKSNGEGEILKYAFTNSVLLKANSVIIKVTGRLFIGNIKRILKRLEENHDFFIQADIYNKFMFADSRMIIANKRFYLEYLLPELYRINESKGVYMEHVLAKAIHKSMYDGHTWIPPFSRAIFVGYSGTGNIKYRYTLLRLLKEKIFLSIFRYLIEVKM